MCHVTKSILSIQSVQMVVLQLLSMAKYFIYLSNTCIILFNESLKRNKWFLNYSGTYGHEMDLQKELNL